MKVAIVTGASSGIGRSAAIEIAKGGNGVILTYSTNPQGGLETAATIEKEGGTAVALPLDVSEAGTFVAFRDRVADVLRDTWQRDTFDHLVNNAGFAQTSLIEDTTEETFDRLMRVLLKGPYFLTQKLLPLMADGGAIVNTSSNSATAATGLEPGYSAYASMKGGLDVLTRYMAKEFSTRGIRVNAVSPGSTRTRIADDAFTRFPEVVPALAAKTALGRVGEPDDIGAMIATLVSDESRWVTAQNIEVSGGYNL
ncbi:SDR family NAD(P)-dependent oxidoreductase [Streptomyces sp. NBC_01637]|jgi:NAD(P)-dependent dehydrogenase (short-subunit alcohol dehydrogenase family)|uniref:SDR family NAD(P)-dependent oxidoreductase n=1 Tax=unclassified Streptomyces TaxID=2593676 RepID=UPI0038708865|nr:SDR family oxidoreductase [Streptomyces sp. NBC_01653]WTD30829.1 SDR family oxidoreductase [Streptomyces sp. NBC_01643]WTD86419.1 SDR family oxidoreductase [Streptomyces sp. NBC_01637]WTC84448.1 SDR family oxidoreductase [Streptomyces sp. NBC_01653]WTD38833.1 SDR family oxidoreductase [Streptomyces sp. NBC_01643]